MPTHPHPHSPRLDALASDLRFALRYFARQKATTAITVAVIALGTGANVAIFSTFQAHFLRPAPAVPRDAARARIWGQERGNKTAQWELRGVSPQELAAFAERRDGVLGGAGDSTTARGVNAQFVTPNFFPALGVRLAAGQGLRPSVGDAGDAPDMTAIMSFAMAQQLYGRASLAVNHRLLVNELPVYVVGVAPPRFQGADRNMDEPALWLPLSARAGIDRVPRDWANGSALSLFARLAPGASHAQATAFARVVVQGVLPDSAARVGMARTADVLSPQALPPGNGSHDELLGAALILSIGALILLVGWMNVSSLMVAAAVGRRHEIAVRLSLGASRRRVLQQLVTESTLVALAGGALGLVMACWLLIYQMKTEIDGVDLSPDLGTFAFALGVAVATGIFFGLSPALHATRGGVSSALRDSGTATSGRSRLQRGFVVAQIALSQPLLVLLGTMLSLVIAEYKPLSPEMSSHVITVAFRPLARTGAPSERAEAVDSLVPRIAARPEVLAAVPEVTAFAIRSVYSPEHHALNPAADTIPTIVHVEGTAPGWFALVDVPIILGRDVSLADTAATGSDYPVVIGSDLARALWGNANPIGHKLASPALRGLNDDSLAMTVVGVYDATRRLPGMTWNGGAANGTPPARVYTARGKQWLHDRILVRTRGPAAPYLSELQRFVRAAAPSLPMTQVRTLAQADEENYRDTLQMSAFAGAGGALALLLASLGLYGVVSLAVRQRTREIGIRIAVGAEPMRVAQMFLASGVRASLVALALGLPLSVAALKIGLSQGLVIAPSVNPYLIGLVIAPLLVAVAAGATWVPARRAAGVDPARTLRVE